ncbi:MAG: hypothetical protein K0S47_1252 [Herbinix sp.]|jgi:hypothetical protein|nr:hypothetical protein [Herbinix sp.]
MCCCFNYICRQLKRLSDGTKIRVYYDGGTVDFSYERVTHRTIVGDINNSPIYIDLSEITGFSVLPEAGWTPIAPGQCIPLPPIPSEVNSVTFDAKTEMGPASTIALTYEGYILQSENDITTTPRTVEWNLGASYPVRFLTLKNKGPSTIYIRNLTTE